LRSGRLGRESNRLDCNLVQARGQWRVHDIHGKDMPRLGASLIQTSREAAAAACKRQLAGRDTFQPDRPDWRPGVVSPHGKRRAPRQHHHGDL
jgi:hypothetical protein